jgi:hypothetical protein
MFRIPHARGPLSPNILLKLYNNNRRLFCGVHGSQKNDDDVGR